MTENVSKAVRHRLKCAEDDFKTSYTRTFYHESLLTQPLYRVRVKTAVSDTACGQSKPPRDFTSVTGQSYPVKYPGYLPYFYGRSSVGRPSNLKSLNEQYAREVVQPIKPGLTVTGLTYVEPRSIFTPGRLSRSSPIADATCSISTFGRGDFPALSVNEPGYHKHLENFVTTTQLKHTDFRSEERKISKDTDANGGRKGFKTKKTGRLDSNFPLPRAAFPKSSPLVPYNAYNTAYNSDYNHKSRRLILWQPKDHFPVLFKLNAKRNDSNCSALLQGPAASRD